MSGFESGECLPDGEFAKELSRNSDSGTTYRFMMEGGREFTDSDRSQAENRLTVMGHEIIASALEPRVKVDSREVMYTGVIKVLPELTRDELAVLRRDRLVASSPDYAAA